jgi:hypothetical protein
VDLPEALGVLGGDWLFDELDAEVGQPLVFRHRLGGRPRLVGVDADRGVGGGRPHGLHPRPVAVGPEFHLQHVVPLVDGGLAHRVGVVDGHRVGGGRRPVGVEAELAVEGDPEAPRREVVTGDAHGGAGGGVAANGVAEAALDPVESEGVVDRLDDREEVGEDGLDGIGRLAVVRVRCRGADARLAGVVADADDHRLHRRLRPAGDGKLAVDGEP